MKRDSRAARPLIPSNSSLPAITDLASLFSFRHRARRMTFFYTGRTRVGGPDLQGLPNRPPLKKIDVYPPKRARRLSAEADSTFDESKTETFMPSSTAEQPAPRTLSEDQTSYPAPVRRVSRRTAAKPPPVERRASNVERGVPPPPVNFQERFSQALLTAGSRVLLLGGMACNVYGSSRHTFDVDYWLDPSVGPSAWAARLLATARTTGDQVEISQIQGPHLGALPAGSLGTLVASTAAAVATDGVIRLSSGEYEVDIFYEANNLPDFEAAWKRSRALDGTLRVLCREDLIATKQGTGRRQDEDDIRFLQEQP